MNMPHTLDHYNMIPATVGGGHKRYAQLISTGIRCFFQPEESSNMAGRIGAEREDKSAEVYLIDQAAFDVIQVHHVIRFAGDFYRVTKRDNVCALGRVFTLDVVLDQTIHVGYSMMAAGGVIAAGNAQT